MAVASATDRGKPEVSQRRQEELARRENVAAEEAKERVRDGAEGWNVGNGEEGGVNVGAGNGHMAKQNAQGFVPWQGSETGFYTENGYPLDV